MPLSASVSAWPRPLFLLAAFGLLIATCGVTPLSAQTSPLPASVSVRSGVASGSGETGASIGGAFTWDFSPRIGIETGAVYTDRGRDANAWSADARMVVTLVPSGRARPYAAAGAGIYRAMFDLDRSFDTFMRQQMGGQPFDRQAMTQFVNQHPMNGFYSQRMNARAQMPAFGSQGMNGMGGMRESFTDPAVSLGGGVRLDLGGRLIARPEARMLVVLRDGRSHTVGMFTMDFGFRF